MGARLSSITTFVVILLKVALFAVVAWLMARGAIRSVEEGGLMTVFALLYGVAALGMLWYLLIHVLALVVLLRRGGND